MLSQETIRRLTRNAPRVARIKAAFRLLGWSYSDAAQWSVYSSDQIREALSRQQPEHILQDVEQVIRIERRRIAAHL